MPLEAVTGSLDYNHNKPVEIKINVQYVMYLNTKKKQELANLTTKT